ncbi:MAG TPA: SDR family oxidoreductase [Xanthobacteraceae bacterium]|jgi:NAD(P)-dependent dehydrogenase (short-subunit alcohol dehydrogenase family)|nr:SDR family oxidoreductase [Xanthobacteraceae bacterium]
MTKPLANRIALVTGASRGIGHATALALANAGAHVVAVARTVGGLEELDDAIRNAGGTATLVPLDLKDFPAIDRLAAALKQRYGRLDILVGNAGILGPLSPLDHVPPNEWDDVLAINVTANWRLIKAFADLLKASDAGRAVFITSGTVHTANAYWGPYTTAKAALEAMARTFAAETATTNVRVNLLSPGQVRTRMLAMAMPSMDMSNVEKPDKAAQAVVAMCLPSVTESGQIFDLRSGKFLAVQAPK